MKLLPKDGPVECAGRLLRCAADLLELLANKETAAAESELTAIDIALQEVKDVMAREASRSVSGGRNLSARDKRVVSEIAHELIQIALTEYAVGQQITFTELYARSGMQCASDLDSLIREKSVQLIHGLTSLEWLPNGKMLRKKAVAEPSRINLTKTQRAEFIENLHAKVLPLNPGDEFSLSSLLGHDYDRYTPGEIGRLSDDFLKLASSSARFNYVGEFDGMRTYVRNEV